MKRLAELFKGFIAQVFAVSSLGHESFDLERELYTARRTARIRTREYRNDGF